MILRKANIYDTNDIAKVHCEVWKAYYGKYVSPEFLEKLGFANRKKFWLKYINEGNIVFVVEEKTGGIVGFAVPKIVKTNVNVAYGEILAHYVGEKAQRSGLGTALMVACAKLFVKNKVPTMSLWIHRDNASTEFYNKIGGRETSAKLSRLDNKDIVKLHFVWDDLERFIETHQSAMDNIVKEY